ncbi:hypothetical protein HMPREF9374_3308 [Desmospora sp. 8437]|nr:hypothetical protein HMPREF9374_3308 [Desmospora sp. 8437]
MTGIKWIPRTTKEKSVGGFNTENRIIIYANLFAVLPDWQRTI